MTMQLTRREFMAKTAAVATGLTALPMGCRVLPHRVPNEVRPNIIVILTDDQGFADVGFNGCRDIPTPHIDSLVSNGVQFTNGYVSHPFCSPSRAGFLTGRYQQRFGHYWNPAIRNPDAGLALDEVILPQVLKPAGYTSGLVGKWHLGGADCYHPLKRGFDEMFGFRGGGHDYFKQQMEAMAPEYLLPLERNHRPVAESEYLTDAFSREAEAFIRRHSDEPFFLYLPYSAPHTPLQAPDKYLSRFGHIEDEKRRQYAAMISAVDDGVGRILTTLGELDICDNTLIFFFSDNGGRPWARHTPLHGGKGSLREGGIREPFVAQWLARLPRGVTYQHPVIAMDIFATAIAAAGAELPGDRVIDGVNLLPHLLGRTDRVPHKSLFWLMLPKGDGAVREGRYKLHVKGPRLYDLETDIAETRDIAAEHPNIVRRLQKSHETWSRQMAPEVAFPAASGPQPHTRPIGLDDPEIWKRAKY